jgi:hypothetical protein
MLSGLPMHPQPCASLVFFLSGSFPAWLFAVMDQYVLMVLAQ